MNLYSLKVNQMQCPVIDSLPAFSWKIASDSDNILQTSYRITVEDGERLLWDSKAVKSRTQSFVSYEGKELSPETEYSWTVTVTDSRGETCTAASSFRTALSNRGGWKAMWAECPFERVSASEYKFGNSYPPVLFEKTFNIDREISSAFVYASAHGAYRLTVNGLRPDDRELAPEFTPYASVLYYQTFDVTKLLTPGTNSLEMYVADGWYFSAQAGPVMKERHPEPSVIFQIKINYADGGSETVISDGTVLCSTDYILYSDLYQGEKQDLTAKRSGRLPALIKNYGHSMLKAQPMPPVRPRELLPAQGIYTSSCGETIVDFGRIIAGRARIRVKEERGSTVTFEYFEFTGDGGEYINTMFAPQKDTLVCDGTELIHEALFTFHGFRYIRVTGMKDPKPGDFTAVLLTTEKENTGSFTCSHPGLNRLYKNIRYSQYNNMLSVPTDCPTREKAGWTGDIQIYARTAMLNENMTPFLTSWLNSVRADQQEDGVVMIVSPYMKLYENLFKTVCAGFGDEKPTGVAGWSDAIVRVPCDMYRITGNTAVLREFYPSMKAWADWIIRRAEEKRGELNIPEEYDRYLWNTGFHFGEWLIPSRPVIPGKPYGRCPESSFYTAPFFGYETMVKMSEISAVLGYGDDEEKYSHTAELMKNAIQNGIFRSKLMPDGLMGAYVLAFAFGLVPQDLYDEYKSRLLTLIHNNGDCLDTGFLATPYLLDVLCALGEKQLAYKILLQEKYPSWLYEVNNGATAIWEGWDADRTGREHGYISFDHYAFGCVDDWICRYICGIDSDTPGFNHLVIAPDCDAPVLSFDRSFECEAGNISVSRRGDRLTVTVPPNTTADISWRGRSLSVGSGTYTL